jgi:hypothetical protein
MAAAGSRFRVAALAGTFLAAIVVGAGTAPSIAAVAYSSVGQYTVGSYTYRNYATVNTNPGIANAITDTAPWGFTAPSGWVGARGRLFTSGGALSCEGTNQYKSGSTPSGTYFGAASCSRLTSGTWYSYGVSLGWNGSGYQSFYTFLSPNQNS